MDQQASRLLKESQELVARGRIHKALRAVDELLRLDPSHSDAIRLRDSLRLLERREKRRFREPRSTQAQLEAGFSYLAHNRNREAIAALTQAGRLSPELHLAHLLLGVAFHREGDVASAKRAYERAARWPSNESTCRDLIASLLRGEPPPPLMEAEPDCDRTERRARRDSCYSLPC